MSSFEKAVKGACKPKPNPPKAKYLDPILNATWSEDGAVHDVCRALQPRFREPNTLIVFKALIVLHTMIRNGSTDNVLSYLSSSDVLRLKNVSAGSWEGYNAPENIQNYSIYLDTRIRAYAQLRHDAIRVQSENNRDMRNSHAIDEAREKPDRGSHRSRKDTKELSVGVGVQRSKTMAGRKLRVMTVEKGLLRETKIVQKMIDSLCECRFYLDDLDNELNITALRMLVKDLLILFQACNEGVINVLEHYFEMFRSDAEEALKIYRHFCKETERVVEYLGIAKKLQNLLNVPVPNLRHAPVSLAGALEEYLKDPNFEQNRIEYKANKDAAERNERSGLQAPPPPLPQSQAKEPESKPSSLPEASSSQAAPTNANKNMMDFFTAIEEEQQTMFNPQTNSPSSAYFQQLSSHNPFVQSQMQMQMMTGAPFGGPQPFVQPQMQPQPTGFIMPQHTSTNPFGMLQQQQQQQQQPAPFLQPQQTSFLQPQSTGSNPFRQSMMFPQSTGMQFGLGMGAQQVPSISTNPFPTQSQGLQNGSNMPNFNAFNAMAGSSQISAPTAQSPFAKNNANAGPARPASAPLTAMPTASASGPPPAQPVKTHQTGSRNPFGAPVTAPPPVPKQPTLFQLATGVGQNNQLNGQQPQGGQQQTSPTSSGYGGMNGFQSQLGAQPTGSAMSSVASAFTFQKPGESNPAGSTATGSTFSDTLFSSLSSQPTGTTSTSFGSPSASLPPANPLQPQKTGFSSGLKAFKPSSSFGAALLESLPPIPQSAPTTPSEGAQPPAQNGTSASGGGQNGLGPQRTGFPGLTAQPTGAFGSAAGAPGNVGAFGTQATGALGSQPTGAGGFGGQPGDALGSSGNSTVGVGLRPQMTGAAGGANPFRATMFSMSPTATGGGGFGAGGGAGAVPSFLSSSVSAGAGGSPFGGANGAPSFATGQFGGPSQNMPGTQQQQSGSLI
ncbi:uncharacterized protein FIBRA_02795 [Fibroporia radiculosa]|uniref:ENTH domain-containing protein n=1 Tax=Fibroporia radiculosa TaxID=599839 RepID=J4GN46_9APHY|nr:uncharacterized protein FIBRA_02795 [Fibroporia radiculosa]CCM00755.1 predicted protein [Fibroporia radiculosa]